MHYLLAKFTYNREVNPVHAPVHTFNFKQHFKLDRI
jgi:hypothetical protein